MGYWLSLGIRMRQITRRTRKPPPKYTIMEHTKNEIVVHRWCLPIVFFALNFFSDIKILLNHIFFSNPNFFFNETLYFQTPIFFSQDLFWNNKFFQTKNLFWSQNLYMDPQLFWTQIFL